MDAYTWTIKRSDTMWTAKRTWIEAIKKDTVVLIQQMLGCNKVLDNYENYMLQDHQISRLLIIVI